MKYKITLHIEADTHPRKWIPETIQYALEDTESIIDCQVEQIDEEDDE